MADIIPSYVKEKENKTLGITYTRYIIPSIATSTTSDYIKLKISPNSTLLFFRISCLSIDYSIYLFNRYGLDINSIEQIFKYENINKEYGTGASDGLRVTPNEVVLNYVNNDTPQEPYMYMKIKNDGGTTGAIVLQMAYSQD